MKTNRTLSGLLITIMLISCGKFNVNEGTYTSVDVFKFINSPHYDPVRIEGDLVTASFKIDDLPDGSRKATLTTTYNDIYGGTVTDHGILDGKGNFIVTKMDLFSQKIGTDTCHYKMDGKFLIVSDPKGILEASSLFAQIPPVIGDSRYHARYFFRKEK